MLSAWVLFGYALREASVYEAPAFGVHRQSRSAARSRGEDAGKLARRLKPKKININDAGVDELVKLPGVGRATAARIIEYRRKNGPFKSVEELVRVKGIGPKKLSKIRALVTVGQKDERGTR